MSIRNQVCTMVLVTRLVGCGDDSIAVEMDAGSSADADEEDSGAPTPGGGNSDTGGDEAEDEALLLPTLPSAGGPAILSAFWGVDDALAPPGSPLFCAGLAGPRDGMPIVLTAEIERSTVAPAVIRVETESGTLKTPSCATLAPADEENEDRTLLLVGDLGSSGDPPVAVHIIGSLPLEDGTNAMGMSIDAITPVAAGPFLVIAERVGASELETGGPDNCPTSSIQIVRTIWSGGIDGENGVELESGDLEGFWIRLAPADGRPEWIHPSSFGDLNDGDNNLDLCLDDARTALEVRVQAMTVTDPTNDYNEETSAVVVDD